MTDPRLLEWARLPGPTKVLAAARQRLEAGHGMGGSPLRVSLTDAERDQVGKLLGTKWALSGRQVGARALADATRSLGTDLETLLAACGGPLRDRPAERAASLRQAADERAKAADVLAAVGVPALRLWTGRPGAGCRGPGPGSCSSSHRGVPWSGRSFPLRAARPCC